MNLRRRHLLIAGALALTGCTSSSQPSGPVPPSAGSAPSATPIDGGDGETIPGDQLAARLQALDRYDGESLRKIVVKPGRYELTSTLRIPSGVHLKATGATFVSKVPGKNGVLVSIANARSVTIEGGTFDGNRLNYSFDSQWRHAIDIYNSRHVTLRGLIATGAQGDGIYVGAFERACQTVRIFDVGCIENARNGCSITSCRDLVVENSIFDNNGTIEPRAGFDIEPHGPKALADDLTVRNCRATGNGSHGLLYVCHGTNTQYVPPTGVMVENCTFDNNGHKLRVRPETGGISLFHPRRITVKQTSTNGNEIGVMCKGDGVGHVSLEGLTIVGNGGEGIRINRATGDFSATKTQIKDNSVEGDQLHSGIFIGEKQGNLSATDCAISGRQQRYALTAAKGAKNVKLIGCDLEGNARGPIEVLAGANVQVV